MTDQETRAKLERHWNTAGARDQEAAHEIYHEDCVVEWPQSGERIRGKANLKALRTAYPAHFAAPFEPPEWRARWVERL